MSGLLQIRNVPDEIRRVLKARAAAEGESLNTYLLGVLDREASRPTVREVLERARQRVGRAPGSILDVIDEMRAERDQQLRADR